MKRTASIEARMGSTRLPGKMFADIHGKPAIERVVERAHACLYVDEVVLATTTEPADDVLVDWAAETGVAFFRGSEEDVLGRVVAAHEFHGSDLVVEITGDCTLLDPGVVDMGIATWTHNECDVVSNTARTSFPMGIDVQVYPLPLLQAVAANIYDVAVREHVSLYFYQNEEKYRVIHLQAPPVWHDPQLRFQLDYPEDLAFQREVYSRLEPMLGPVFGVGDIFALLRSHPEIAGLNRASMIGM